MDEDLIHDTHKKAAFFQLLAISKVTDNPIE